jgi:hypothetical protein
MSAQGFDSPDQPTKDTIVGAAGAAQADSGLQTDVNARSPGALLGKVVFGPFKPGSVRPGSDKEYMFVDGEVKPASLEDRIAEGAFGRTVRVIINGASEVWKLIPIEGDPAAVEARVTAEVNFARVLDGDDGYFVTIYNKTRDRNGRYCVIRMRAAGTDLERMLTEEGPLDVPTAVLVVMRLARGLAQAHRKGVVHNDIKPANVLVKDVLAGDRWLDGTVKCCIADFGMCESRLPDIEQRTHGGTPVYMAPERLEGACCEPRSDLWSLGVLAYRLLTGHFPWDEDEDYRLAVDRLNQGDDQTLVALYHVLRTKPFTPLTTYVPYLDRRIAACLEQLLEVQPDARPASMQEVVATLCAIWSETELRNAVAHPTVSADTPAERYLRACVLIGRCDFGEARAAVAGLLEPEILPLRIACQAAIERAEFWASTGLAEARALGSAGQLVAKFRALVNMPYCVWRSPDRLREYGATRETARALWDNAENEVQRQALAGAFANASVLIATVREMLSDYRLRRALMVDGTTRDDSEAVGKARVGSLRQILRDQRVEYAQFRRKYSRLLADGEIDSAREHVDRAKARWTAGEPSAFVHQQLPLIARLADAEAGLAFVLAHAGDPLALSGRLELNAWLERNAAIQAAYDAMRPRRRLADSPPFESRARQRVARLQEWRRLVEELHARLRKQLLDSSGLAARSHVLRELVALAARVDCVPAAEATRDRLELDDITEKIKELARLNNDVDSAVYARDWQRAINSLLRAEALESVASSAAALETLERIRITVLELRPRVVELTEELQRPRVGEPSDGDLDRLVELAGAAMLLSLLEPGRTRNEVETVLGSRLTEIAAWVDDAATAAVSAAPAVAAFDTWMERVTKLGNLVEPLHDPETKLAYTFGAGSGTSAERLRNSLEWVETSFKKWLLAQESGRLGRTVIRGLPATPAGMESVLEGGRSAWLEQGCSLAQLEHRCGVLAPQLRRWHAGELAPALNANVLRALAGSVFRVLKGSRAAPSRAGAAALEAFVDVLPALAPDQDRRSVVVEAGKVGRLAKRRRFWAPVRSKGPWSLAAVSLFAAFLAGRSTVSTPALAGSPTADWSTVSTAVPELQAEAASSWRLAGQLQQIASGGDTADAARARDLLARTGRALEDVSALRRMLADLDRLEGIGVGALDMSGNLSGQDLRAEAKRLSGLDRVAAAIEASLAGPPDGAATFDQLARAIAQRRAVLLTQAVAESLLRDLDSVGAGAAADDQVVAAAAIDTGLFYKPRFLLQAWRNLDADGRVGLLADPRLRGLVERLE